tara:strand:- start:10 stop:285 length:276 start_codon:yes stop_codon:yes gene_type:complete
MIDKAILAINANAVFKISAKKTNVDNVDKSTIEWLNGTTPISNTDIKTKMSELETAIANAETTEKTKKASGKQKLLDLGLSEEEVKALIGV